ncbi:MAG: hypothetical protein AAF825_10720 [Pseudomonadota bacterium]
MAGPARLGQGKWATTTPRKRHSSGKMRGYPKAMLDDTTHGHATQTPSMTDYTYRTRPGSLWLSLFALAGVTLLSAVIWTIAPAFAVILLLPSVLICVYQMIASPVYGLSLTAEAWRVHSEEPDFEIPLADIARAELSGPDATLHLRDGTRLALPASVLPKDRSALIEAARARGLTTGA